MFDVVIFVYFLCVLKCALPVAAWPQQGRGCNSKDMVVMGVSYRRHRVINVLTVNVFFFAEDEE